MSLGNMQYSPCFIWKQMWQNQLWCVIHSHFSQKNILEKSIKFGKIWYTRICYLCIVKKHIKAQTPMCFQKCLFMIFFLRCNILIFGWYQLWKNITFLLTVESKMGLFWSFTMENNKQFFLQEKFLSSVSDEGKLYILYLHLWDLLIVCLKNFENCLN